MARRTRLVLIVLLIAAIALITLDFRDGGQLAGARRRRGRVFGPVERTASDVTGPLKASSAPRAAGTVEIASLQKQNDQLRAQLAQAQVATPTPAQLASLLHLTPGDYSLVFKTDRPAIRISVAAGRSATATSWGITASSRCTTRIRCRSSRSKWPTTSSA